VSRLGRVFLVLVVRVVERFDRRALIHVLPARQRVQRLVVSRRSVVGCAPRAGRFARRAVRGRFHRGRRRVLDLGVELGIELLVSRDLWSRPGVVLLRAPPPAGEVCVEVIGTNEILDMEERRAFLPDVDEGGLEPWKDAGHPAEDDVPYAPGVLVAGAFEVELGDDAVLDEGDAGFFGFNADYEEILGHDGLLSRLALDPSMNLLPGRFRAAFD
jgi:hypothetical protein